MRKTMGKTDSAFIILLLVVAIVGAWYVMRKNTNAGSRPRALLYYSKNETLEIDLNTAGRIQLPSNHNVVLEVREDGSVGFVEADCPDRICINSGFLSRPGETAACLPNDALLVIESSDGQGDGPDIIV